MSSAHRRRIRDDFAWTILTVLSCLSAALARPIPKEQFATLGDFPDFVALSENITSQYFSNEVLQQFVHGLGEQYPDYVTVFKIGDSVQGTPILAMDIGSAAGDLDEKPFFLWVGNMHGNEPTGRPLLLSLALHLASSKSALVQKVRNRMHTIIVPTMNPDGFKSADRNNANMKDLNRAFPDRADPGVQPSLPMSGNEEPEVQAIMKLAYSLPITGSASLHEGALVANYPWDGDKERKQGYSAAPDDATFQYLAKSYAQKHTRMAEQTPYQGQTRAGEFFKGGITNGNDWYPVFNGMQDWLYIARGCRALTLELWTEKWPSEDLLPVIWDENREAMLTLSSTAALGGVHGTLRGPGAAKATVTAGGLPVHAYAIPHSPDDVSRRILLNADSLTPPDTTDTSENATMHDVHAFAASADAVFHLPLAPGRYTITVSAPGAKAVEKRVDVPDSGGGVGVHVELVQDESADALTGADDRDAAGGVFETGFPYEAIAGRGASSSSGAGIIMQVHPAVRLDNDSADRDDRSTAGSGTADDMATADSGSTTGGDDRSSATTATSDTTTDDSAGGATTGGLSGESTKATNGTGAEAGDTSNAAVTETSDVNSSSSKGRGSGSVEVQEVAEEPPHSTAFFILRGAMATAGAVFIIAQLLRLRGRNAAVGTVPARRGHHHQQMATKL